MVLIVQVHLLSLSSDIADAVVIGPVQVLHLAHQVISLHPQPVQTHLDVPAVGLVAVILTLQRFNLLLNFENPVMRVEKLLLKSLYHAHLTLEVL